MSKITFLCSIAETQTALKFGGNIGRVTFEVPQGEVANAVALIALQGQPLRVTVEIEDGNSDKEDDNSKAKSSGQKNGRAWP